MDDLKKEIGKRIKQCRKEKGMTQKELAREVGCHEGTIRQYENGLRSPRLVSQYAIAKALSVPHESLFTLSAPCAAQLGTNLAEVGTDCISRQDAIETIGKTSDELYENIKKGATFPQRQWFDGMAQAQSILENLPSAQPEQRYTEEELRVFKHGISLSLLSKRSSQHWQYDEDTATEIKFLERLYEKVSADMRGAE